jgi:hypothetical protein
MLGSPPRRRECLRHVGFVLTLSGASQTRRTPLHGVMCVSDAFDSPLRRQERLRRIGFTLTSSGASQMYWTRPHAIRSLPDVFETWLLLLSSGASQVHLTHPHAVCSIPDTLDSPSCCLERSGCIRLTSTLSGHLARPRCV